MPAGRQPWHAMNGAVPFTEISECPAWHTSSVTIYWTGLSEDATALMLKGECRPANRAISSIALLALIGLLIYLSGRLLSTSNSRLNRRGCA